MLSHQSNFLLGTALCVLMASPTATAADTGDAQIRGKVGGSDLVITTTARVAGAIHSVNWNGKEFIDSFDHGRQLQSAGNFDCDGKFIPEVFNPTEAGSLADGAGPTSSSKLLRLQASGDTLETSSQMAFWLAPGEQSDGHPACNRTILSEHHFSKRVKIGSRNLTHAIEYDVTFTLPENEPHKFAQFESLTGYMPNEFDRFWRFNSQTNAVEPIDAGPGEQPMPLILATADGNYAMGILSLDRPQPGFQPIGYGRWHFDAERVNKWNCVHRVRNSKSVPPGDYRFRHLVIVGNLESVRETMRAAKDRTQNGDR